MLRAKTCGSMEEEPVIIERADGTDLFDTEGKRYIDGVSSLWCNVHGHNVAELNAAVVDQLGKIAHSTLLGLANVPSVLLAKRLVELARIVGLNEYKLKHGFKEIFQTTVFGYLAEKRLELARDYLIDPNKSITDIADLLGYSSIQHFSFAFKKKFGHSPKEGRGNN